MILPDDSAFVVGVLDMDTPGVGTHRVGDDGCQAYQHVAGTSTFIWWGAAIQPWKEQHLRACLNWVLYQIKIFFEKAEAISL